MMVGDELILAKDLHNALWKKGDKVQVIVLDPMFWAFTIKNLRNGAETSMLHQSQYDGTFESKVTHTWCVHKWKEYTGLTGYMDVFNYCEKCGIKEKDV